MKLTPWRKSALVAAALLATGATRADTTNEADKLTREWINTRLETEKLKSDWTYGREIMTSTLHGLNERAAELEKQLADRKAKHADEDAELAALRDRKSEAIGKQAQVTSAIAEVAHQALALRPTLPPRLSDALDVAYSSLAAADAGSPEQMQLAMTVINRCIQFNRTITYDEEAIALPGEPRPKMLEVIYWGLSQAYAVDRQANRAWRGSAQDTNWSWQPLESSAADVAALIDMYNDKAEPAFVSLRAQIKKSSEPFSAHRP